MVERGGEARGFCGIGPASASRCRPGRGHLVQNIHTLRKTRRRRPARRPRNGESRAHLAAWDARNEVVLDDVKRAALLALSHRRRRGPFEQPGMELEELENALSEDR